MIYFLHVLIQFIDMGVVRNTWRFQKTELIYDANSLHIARLQQKQQIDIYSDFNWFTNSLVLETEFFIGTWSVGRGDILSKSIGDFQNFSGGCD